MNKVFTSLILLSLLLMMPAAVIAVDQVPTTSIDTVAELIELLDKLVNYLYTFLLIVAGAYLVWGGLDFVLGGNEEDKVKSGRNKIKYALIGVAVAVISKGLMNIVINLVD